MKIYLIRHSNAVPDGFNLADADRYLSDRGRQVARSVGARLKAEGVELDSILTSPLCRAVQTAELIAGTADYIGAIRTLRGLRPGSSPAASAEDIVNAGQSVAVISHMPTISGIGAFLTARPSFPGFLPCQVFHLDNRQAAWTLDPQSLEVSIFHNA